MTNDRPENRLDEYDKTEWRDVCKTVRPDLTDKEFDAMWDDFCEMKAKKRAQ